MRVWKFYIMIMVTTMMTYACTKPFAPTVTTINANILVVEGFINTGPGPTAFKLSRTVVIADATVAGAETASVLTVEDQHNNSYTLPETSAGTHLGTLNLNSAGQYRIRIKTKNGQTYLSDFVQAKASPPIDSVGYSFKGNGVVIYANTHDPTNNTRYYKYTFSETWQFQSAFDAQYKSNGTAIVLLTGAQRDHYCFGADSSTNVVINSTAALSQDVAYQFPITAVDSNSEKIELKYSILVTQKALTSDAYEFWNNLKGNTENLGSIFDAQPSQLTGNIHNIANAAEPVIGYISAGTIQQKRIFINRTVFPLKGWTTIYPYYCPTDPTIQGSPANYLYCEPKSMPCINDVAMHLVPLNTGISPIDAILDNYNNIVGFTGAPTVCVDCTVRGTNVQPAFWK